MYLALKLVHILSSTVLFGTGLGTAFSMWRAHVRADARVVSAVTHNVVLADWWFTTPAVIAQPVTGFALVRLAGFPLSSTWLELTFVLYVLAGACWIPVVWLQLRMRALANEAAVDGQPLSPRYYRYFKLWFWLGWPAFLSVVVIFALMVFKPVL